MGLSLTVSVSSIEASTRTARTWSLVMLTVLIRSSRRITSLESWGYGNSCCAENRAAMMHMNQYINCTFVFTNTYDHRTLKTRLPVRSALFKQRTGGLVVRWVTTSEYPLLYVFDVLHPLHIPVFSIIRTPHARPSCPKSLFYLRFLLRRLRRC
jgi:hypothetical protein